MTSAPETKAAGPVEGPTAKTRNDREIQAQGQANGKRQTTLGSSLFYDPLAGAGGLGDIRHRLELKYCACLVIGGPSACLIDVDRIKDNRLRALAGCGMVFRDWTIRNLIACTGDLEGAAAAVLIATLENPTWGPEDFRLLDLIERVELMRETAWKGDRTL